jgi:hypothetical protein
MGANQKRRIGSRPRLYHNVVEGPSSSLLPNRGEQFDTFDEILDRDGSGLAGPAYVCHTYCWYVVVRLDERACRYREGVFLFH